LITNAADSLNTRYPEHDDDKRILILAETINHAEGRRVRVAVEDRGTGIPESVIARIFDPFFSTKERYQGIGLGLSISYGLVKDHGGELSVESVLGEFARFSFDLPVA